MSLLSAIFILFLISQAPTSQPAVGSRPDDGEVAATQPASQPAVPGRTSANGSAPDRLSSGDPVVDDLLDRQEAKRRVVKGLSADIVYRYISTVPVEEEQKKFGSLLFAGGEPNASLLIHFTRLVADGVVSKNEEYYAFDGRWYVERKDADAVKTVLRREICRAGERMDPFGLGTGPFPLPFGQKREEILRQFEVSLALYRPGDPADTKHLHCVPRKDSRMADEYTRVEFYIDPSIDLPIKITTQRRSDESRVEVEFKNIQLDAAPALSRFKLETPPGFRETIETLEDKPVIDITPEGELPTGK